MDGSTVLPDILTLDEGISSRIWSHEDPTKEDYCIWNDAICLITSPLPSSDYSSLWVTSFRVLTHKTHGCVMKLAHPLLNV
jgi:hypothetical protein